MIVEWLGQQLASVELTRMKYSGSDFKFTSQANHMAKLKNLKEKYEAEGFHLQRLYKRRKRDVTGIMKSTLSEIMGGKILQLESERLLEKGQLLGEEKGRAEGRKTERIEAIQNMISLGLTKEKILTVYSEEEYNEAVKSMLVEA